MHIWPSPIMGCIFGVAGSIDQNWQYNSLYACVLGSFFVRFQLVQSVINNGTLEKGQSANVEN